MATFKQLRDARNGYWWFVLALTIVMIIAVSLAETSALASRAAQFTVIDGGKAGVVTSEGSLSAVPAPGRAVNGGAAGPTGARQVQGGSSLVLVALPLAGGIVVTLLDYLVRALLVFLMSMVLGGKAAFKEVFRMAAWTTVPAAIRRGVQTLAVLLTGGQVAAGFSAALSAVEIRTLPLVNLLLGYIDIYTLWSVLLLGIGAAITGKLSKGKAAFAVAIYVGVSLVGILVYFAVTNAISGALSGGSPRGGLPGGGARIRPGG